MATWQLGSRASRDGLGESYSVFLVALVREFGWSRSLVTGAFSFLSLIHGGLGPVIGWILRRVGPRRVILVGVVVMAIGLVLSAETTTWWHLYMAFGVITALGISLNGWVPLVVLVRGWFPHRVGTAMGIASAGIGAGIFGFVPLSQILIDGVGWRWTFRVLAVVTVGWGLPAAFWLVKDPPSFEEGSFGPHRPEALASAGGYWTLAAAVRSRRFWGLAGVYFMGNCVTQMLMIHQVAYLVDHGVPALIAATVGGAVGLVSIGANSLPYLYALLIGLGYSVLSPVFPAVASDLFGGPGFSTIYGALYTVICLALASGPWAAGRIFDLTGSYATALWVGLAMAVVSPALLWVVGPRRPNPPPESPDRS
ncbi:MAG: MFS transporter [candidate division NC10 bacterium]|nr:MFS transporter [candidate division NC10 bacterium]